ncbi:MAG: class I SAM-dependent methyltransferase [Candidatus Hodarchaeota archaeon]
MNKNSMINKSMDLEDLKSDKAKTIIKSLNHLVKNLREKNLKISSWYGRFNLSGNPDSFERINRGYDYIGLEEATDDKNFPWFLYWEIVWVDLINEFSSQHKILDLGGSSSLFSYYLASKGIDVTTVDLQENLVENANTVANQMNWNLKNYVMDMRNLKFNSKFDHITSICVYEHIPLYDRVEINKKIKELLIYKGKFSITFDYRNPSKFTRINSPSDVLEQFVKPSGLFIRGNKEFFDNGKSYLLHPFYYTNISWKYKIRAIMKKQFSPCEFFRTKQKNDYTFGALFLEKV